MVTNRSVPASTVLPHIAYRNAAEASDWLTAMFGFTGHYRYGPPGVVCASVSSPPLGYLNGWRIVGDTLR